MRLRLPWPRSLGGRTVAVLLAAVVVVHLGSMVAYRESAANAASAAQATQLAGRLVTAARAIADRPTGERDQTAHDLSSASLSLHWSERMVVDTFDSRDTGLGTLRDRLIELLPYAGKDGIRLGYGDRHPPRSAHALLGSLPLPDHSYINFSVPLLAEAAPMLPATLLSTSVMASGVAVVAVFLMRSLGSPLRNLARAADAIGRGPPIVVTESGPAEVRHLAEAFNAMQSRMRLLMSDRTQALAAVSHDLRTPITRLRLRAGFMTDQEVRAAVDADLDEMEAMIDATLAYLRGDAEPEEPKATDLAVMLATLVDAANDAGRPAVFKGPRHAYLPLRSLAMKRAFTNLVDNALTYGGTAQVNLQDVNTMVHVTVDDDGPGIPDSERSRVFEPFQRLDASRNRRTGGVGLGLTIARQAVEREGGTIRLLNRAEGGLRAEVSIPRRAPTPGVLASKPSITTTTALTQFG